ncbi:MAG: alanine--tRNA ligase, partial [Bdellovibrionaceae bacterium]|nr:alanine--tRNA ligase [Pseudobdellovibrionaceae bacterium]
RSTSFLIADGALPSNEGRGYVLRRIMRRAIRYGRKLSDKSFLPSMAEVLIAEMSSVYPELSARREHIISTIRDEEARFLQTLDQGTEILQQEIAKAHRTGTKMIAGEVVFKLYDTFGFPMDLTRLMAAENGLTIDESGFEKQMQMARSKAKASWKGKALNSDEAHLISFSQSVAKNAGPTRFIGYDHLTGKAKVVALSDGHKEVPFLRGGQGGVMICAETPFYAEGGGQVGDQGEFAHGLTRGFIHNTTKNFDVHLHHIHVDSGELRVGDEVDLCVAASERRNTASNHSATHLLHAALRKLLGPHVTQAGSVVDADRLRFDFTHNKPLTNDEIHQLELMVNEQIAQAHNVEAQTMKHKDALAAGALALFGEKYGEEVRVLRMGQFSCELCGGTHVRNTSQIRVFKIVSESGVSAGVRRIEAITGDVALRWLTKNAHENQQARALAGLQESWDKYLNSEPGLPKWIQSQQELVRSLERELKKAKGSQVNLEELLKSATGFQTSTGKAAKLLFADVEIDDREILAQLTDRLKDKVGTGIIVALGRGAESHPLIVSVTKDLLETYKAGEILKNVAATLGGKGGGRPDFAQGAVPRRDGLEAAKNYLSKLVGS